MRLVIDEWLWADLGGENEAEQRRESFVFLREVFERCDQLVTVAKSSFIKKFWAIAKDARTEESRRIVRVFKAQFFWNSDKLLQYQETELQPCPEEMRGGVKKDDQYLVRVYLTADADVLVTTDKPLMNELSGHNIHCQARDDFLRKYLSK